MYIDEEKKPKHIYHYTSMETAFEHILPKNSLKINSCTLTNDPYESKKINFNYNWSMDHDSEKNIYSGIFIGNKILDIINKNTYLLCCSQDLKIQNQALIEKHGKSVLKGSMNFSLWNLYGNRHRGVCLVFDRALLNNEITNQFENDYIITNDEIDYSYLCLETPDKLEPFEHIPLDTFLNSQDDEKIFKHVVDQYIEFPNLLHFIKDKTWEGEAEYRWVLFNRHFVPDNQKKELYINFKKSLKQVVLGTDFSEAYSPYIIDYCNQNQIQLFKIDYSDGTFNMIDVLIEYAWGKDLNN